MAGGSLACGGYFSLPHRQSACLEEQALVGGGLCSEVRRLERAHLSSSGLDDELWSRRQDLQDFSVAASAGPEGAPMVPLILALSRLAAQRDAQIAANGVPVGQEGAVGQMERLG